MFSTKCLVFVLIMLLNSANSYVKERFKRGDEIVFLEQDTEDIAAISTGPGSAVPIDALSSITTDLETKAVPIDAISSITTDLETEAVPIDVISSITTDLETEAVPIDVISSVTTDLETKPTEDGVATTGSLHTNDNEDIGPGSSAPSLDGDESPGGLHTNVVSPGITTGPESFPTPASAPATEEASVPPVVSTVVTIPAPTEAPEPIVSTEEGKLRGTIETLFDGSQFYSFKGIPYAEAPVGPLRFKAPLPAKPWRGIRDASNHGPVCTQYDTSIEQYIQGSEDCLFLNVYTRSLDPSAKIPVMVYIHGGSYMSGSGNSDTYSPDLLLQHDVILVTMNYRLEVLGFLSLNNADVPGNAGMKDQVAALRWVQDNIEQFGGDPESVTLFGESSGASAVTYHMLSPMSKGLFHKAIVQSGVCLEDWAQGQDSVDRAFRVGKVLGRECRNKTELVKFLREVNPLNLTNLTYKTLANYERNRGLPEHFVPIVEETFHPGPEAFISENPSDLLQKGKVNRVPLMIGYNSGEGLFMLDYQLKNLDNNNRFPANFVPRSLVQRLSEERIVQFAKRIKRFYAGKRQFTRYDLDQLRDIQTDLHYAYNTHRFAHMYQSLNESVYMYRFDFDTDLNIVKKYTGYTTLKGACHADDLFYIFYNSLNKRIIDRDPKLRKTAYRITRLWTNFAKYGQPTPNDSLGVLWAPYTTEGKEYLKLGEPMAMDQNADRCRIDFWNKLYRDASLPYIKKK